MGIETTSPFLDSIYEKLIKRSYFSFGQKLPKSPVDEPIPKKKDTKKSKFAEQMRLALREVPSPEPVEEVDIYKSPTPTPTPPPSPPPKEPSPVKSPSPKPKKEVKPLRPIEKFVSRPKAPTPPP